MKWFDKLIGKKAAEEVTDETVTSTSEDERRAILEKEKQEATKKGEAWVAVLDTQINPDDIIGIISLLKNYSMQAIAAKLMSRL